MNKIYRAIDQLESTGYKLATCSRVDIKKYLKNANSQTDITFKDQQHTLEFSPFFKTYTFYFVGDVPEYETVDMELHIAINKLLKAFKWTK